jgi:hypothetical protein
LRSRLRSQCLRQDNGQKSLEEYRPLEAVDVTYFSSSGMRGSGLQSPPNLCGAGCNGGSASLQGVPDLAPR